MQWVKFTEEGDVVEEVLARVDVGWEEEDEVVKYAVVEDGVRLGCGDQNE